MHLSPVFCHRHLIQVTTCIIFKNFLFLYYYISDQSFSVISAIINKRCRVPVTRRGSPRASGVTQISNSWHGQTILAFDWINRLPLMFSWLDLTSTAVHASHHNSSSLHLKMASVTPWSRFDSLYPKIQLNCTDTQCTVSVHEFRLVHNFINLRVKQLIVFHLYKFSFFEGEWAC